MQIGQAGTITDLDVCINSDHTWPGDLYITLTHGATTVVLMNRPGGVLIGCDQDDIQAYLDDEATFSVDDECPLIGEFTPHEPLSAFDGASFAGTWTLSIWDQSELDTGNLTGFFLWPTLQ